MPAGLPATVLAPNMFFSLAFIAPQAAFRYIISASCATVVYATDAVAYY